ncbi:MAG: amylo-alpha-1,6-glucosidase [Bacteroidales bacterium]|nr:amylo-alpha-1,6-glucosidase [Bacteroidales bacterium]
MSYIQFDKTQLINLEFSLAREIIQTNRSGSYSYSTIIGCNTRKYHGLLVVPQPKIDDDLHILLSGLDVSVKQNNESFNLGIHGYKGGNYSPKGHKYIRNFSIDNVPKLVYRVGGMVLSREMFFFDQKDTFIQCYSLEESSSPLEIVFQPFLAFRNVHFLTRHNNEAKTDFQLAANGISYCMYPNYTPLYLQFSKEPQYQHQPYWYYDIEYFKEIERGYDAHEDLLVPGTYTITLHPGEKLYVTAGIEEMDPQTMETLFEQQKKKRILRDSFENCLLNTAQQFFVTRNQQTALISGYPFFRFKSRAIFMALHGLTLARNNLLSTCRDVLTTMVKTMQGPFFPEHPGNRYTDYKAVDIPLLFIRSFQKYYKACPAQEKPTAWQEFGKIAQMILESYREGTRFDIKMQDNGLITAGSVNDAVTWMNAIVDGHPVTPRYGYIVEVNALWYNAICFIIAKSKEYGDNDFVASWQPIADKIPSAFEEIFWSDEKKYLADYVADGIQNWQVRPNMIFATSLPFSPISEDHRKMVLSKVKQELLTPVGIRTLSPADPDYHNIFRGDQHTRDIAYHNGIVFPWLLEYFTEGYLRIHGKGGLSFIKRIYREFEPQLYNHGIGTIPEAFEPDPPYKAAGSISQAVSVSALLRMKEFIDRYENM